MKLNTEVNRGVPFHITAEVEKGKCIITLNKVVKKEGSKEVELEEVDAVEFSASNAKELKETAEHFRWQFGKIMKEIAAQEEAINGEMKQEVVEEELEAVVAGEDQE